MKNFRRVLFCAVLLLSFGALKGFAQEWEWEWAKSVGGENRESGHSITTDKAANVYVTGYFNSSTITFGDFTLINSNSNHYNGNMFIAKYDSKGKVLWAKSVGGTSSGNSITTDSVGNIYVTGSFSSQNISLGSYILFNTNTGANDIFFSKFDKNGNVLWAKSAGGLGNDESRSISVDNNGNFYITGFFHTSPITFGSTTLTNAGDADIFIAKYDANANVLWARSAGGKLYESGNKIITDNGGNLYVLGSFNTPLIIFGTDTVFNITQGGSTEVFIVKYDSDGNVIWTKSIGGFANDSGNGIAVDKDGSIYVTGYFSNTFITIEEDTLINAGKADIFIIKYDKDSKLVWAKSIGGTEDDVGGDITLDTKGNIYVGGEFSSNITLGTLTLNNSKYGFADIVVAKYDSDGNELWAKSAGGNISEGVSSINVDTSENIYVTGIFNSPFLNFSTITLSSEGIVGSGNIFVAKITHSITSISEEITDKTISLFPNPTTSQFHITNLSPGNWTITIYTLDGQPVFKKEITGENAMIDLSGKAKGAYVYRLLKDGEVFKSGKLVVE